MRRGYFLGLLVLAGWLPAEGAEAQGLGLGGGLNLSKLIGQDPGVIQSTQRKGLNLGGALSFPLIGPVSLQPEVYYAQKGQRQESANAAATLQLDYLEVPALARVELPGTSFLRPHLTGGPAFAWNLRCDLAVESEIEEAAGSSCDDNPAAVQFGRADRGFVVGGGARIALRGIGLVFDARMVRGLKRLEDEGAEGDTRNQAFSFLARLSFGGR